MRTATKSLSYRQKLKFDPIENDLKYKLVYVGDNNFKHQQVDVPNCNSQALVRHNNFICNFEIRDIALK